MKFIIISDSHGRESGIARVLAMHPDADGVFFLGDGYFGAEQEVAKASIPFIGVAGNCDGAYLSLSEHPISYDECVTFLGVKIMLTHGHLEGVKSSLGGLISLAKRRGCDIALFGHTHEKYDEYISFDEKPLRLFNPGSISRPASGNPSFGLLTLTESGILLSHGELS